LSQAVRLSSSLLFHTSPNKLPFSRTGFRTEWSGGSMIFGEIKNPAYDHIPAEENAKKRDKTQGGDPAKAGEAFYKLAVMENPPLRVVLGSDACKGFLELYLGWRLC
jgi:hypothetical protein